MVTMNIVKKAHFLYTAGVLWHAVRPVPATPYRSRVE